jgi:hypothetical protein
MEVTKWLKPSISVSRFGDSASVQAATRVNAEQASKRKMCGPTRRLYRGRLIRLVKRHPELAPHVASPKDVTEAFGLRWGSMIRL